MKYKKKQELKRKLAGAIAIMIVIVMVLGLVLPVFAATSTQAIPAESNQEKENTTKEKLEKEIGSEYFDADISAGFDGMYLVGNSVPVRGTITNKGKAFRGELQVKSYVYQEMDLNDMDYKEYILYSKQMELAEGARETVDMEVVMGTVVKHLEVSLVTETGEVVFRKNISVKALSPDTAAIAILSGQPEQVRYLSQLEKNMGQYKTKVLFLDEKSFPVSKEVMESFSAVIIDDIDTSDLQQAQKNALADWVRGGGLLILGTGTHSSRVLGGLDFLEDISIENSIPVSSLETTKGERIGLSVPMDVVEIKKDNAEPIWKNGDIVLTDKIQIGAGKVFLHHFALGLAPFGSLPQAGTILGDFYTANGQEYWTGNAENIERKMSERPVANFFTRVPSMENAPIYFIFAIIILYILLVGPVLYYVLKKRECQGKGWVIIPMSALVCMGLILLISRVSGYRDSIVQVASIIEVKQSADIGNARVGINIMSPRKGDVTFSGEGMTGFHVSDQNHNWGSVRMENNTEKCIYKIEVGESPQITFYDNGIWQNNQLQTDAVVQLGGTIENDVHLIGDICKGTVTNNTTVDFSDAYLDINGFFLALGSLPAGESVTVKEKYDLKNNMDTYENINRVIWQCRGEDNPRDLVRKKKVTKQQAFYLQQQQDMLTSIRDENFIEEPIERNSRKQRVARFYGFSQAPLYPQEKYVNGKSAKETNLNLYYTDFWKDLAYEKEFTTPYSFGAEVMADQNNVYVNYGNAFRGYCNLENMTEKDQEVETTYGLDEALRIDAFCFSDMDGTEFSQIKAQIYNRSTDKWEDLQRTPYKQTSSYLNEKNQIQVRVTIPPNEGISMPQMSIEGGGKFA